MAAPFSSEELFAKRSLLTSIWGMKSFLPKTTSHNSSAATQSAASSSSASSSSTSHAPLHVFRSKEAYALPQPSRSSPVVEAPAVESPPPYLDAAGDVREGFLSDHLAHSLLVESPHSPDLLRQSIRSPADIYNEIVYECAPFENLTQEQEDSSPVSVELRSPSPELAALSVKPAINAHVDSSEVCPHCHNHTNPNTALSKKTFLEGLSSKSNLEDLVKIVVAAVRDASGLAKVDKKIESPEEILRRKRQQNNEAAARYRQRQREAKITALNELQLLETRNSELKAEIRELESQLENVRRQKELLKIK